MALHLNLDHQGRVYFALSCDGCGAVFTCYDDGCYRFASLRTEAVFAGWDVVLDPQLVQAGYWTWSHPQPGPSVGAESASTERAARA